MADDPTPSAPSPTPPAQTPPQPPPATPSTDDTLGEAGMRALHNEREARREAERLLGLSVSGAQAVDVARRERDDATQRAAEAEERLAEANTRASEVDSLRARMDAADERARRANLSVALVGQGITGPQAAAVARLLEGVEYNDSQEPTNLPDRITAAKAQYPAAWFDAPPPELTPTPATGHPNLHNGARPPVPDADENEKFNAAMAELFPGVTTPQQQT